MIADINKKPKPNEWIPIQSIKCNMCKKEIFYKYEEKRKFCSISCSAKSQKVEKKRTTTKNQWKQYWENALDDLKFRERNSEVYRTLDRIFHTERFTKIK